MANKRISTLDDISLVGGTSTPGLTTSDIIPVTDVDDTTGSLQGTTKKVTVADLLSGYQAEPAEGAFVDGDKTKLDSALQSLTAGALSDFDFDDNAIFGFGASVNTPTITANAYTVTDADNGKVLALDNGATAMDVNINTGLPAGFNCSFIQTGSGQVTFAGTATLNNRQSHTKINAQYGVASIVAYAADTFVLAGDTAA
jgi:hypothetical protein